MKINRILLSAVGLLAGLLLEAQTVAFRWVDNWQFTGHGTCQTAPFRLWSDSWRVNYRPLGEAPFKVYACNAKTGARIAITEQESTRRALSGFRSGKGEMELVYLAITAPTASWQLNISQYMDKPTEWQYLKWQKHGVRVTPFGSWGYAEGEREITLEIKEKAGRMSFRQTAPGRLHVEVIDEAGTIVADMVSVGPGTMETWFYQPGIYVVRASAIKTDWNVLVETLE